MNINDDDNNAINNNATMHNTIIITRSNNGDNDTTGNINNIGNVQYFSIFANETNSKYHWFSILRIVLCFQIDY